MRKYATWIIARPFPEIWNTKPRHVSPVFRANMPSEKRSNLIEPFAQPSRLFVKQLCLLTCLRTLTFEVLRDKAKLSSLAHALPLVRKCQRHQPTLMQFAHEIREVFFVHKMLTSEINFPDRGESRNS